MVASKLPEASECCDFCWRGHHEQCFVKGCLCWAMFHDSRTIPAPPPIELCEARRESNGVTELCIREKHDSFYAHDFHPVDDHKTKKLLVDTARNFNSLRDQEWITALKDQGIHAEICNGGIVFKHVVLGERRANER